MKKCAYCDTEYDDKDKKCPGCGAPLLVDVKEETEEKEQDLGTEKLRNNDIRGKSRLIYGILAIFTVMVIAGAALSFVNNPQRKIDEEAKKVYEKALEHVVKEDYDQALHTLNSINEKWTDYQVVVKKRVEVTRMLTKENLKRYESAGDYAGMISHVRENVSDIENDPELEEIYKSAIQKYKDEVFVKVEEYLNVEDYVSAWSILDTAQRILVEDDEIDSKKREVKLKEILSNVIAFEEQQDYAGAINYINENMDVIDNNTDILMKLSNCEQKYREEIRVAAETAYESDGHTGALSIINEAMAVLKDDETFLSLKQKYEELAPVYLRDLSAYIGGLHQNEHVKDNMGNVYQSCFVAYGDEVEAIYDIGMEYKTFSAKVAVTKAEVNEALFYDNYASLIIKGDDKILYEEKLLSITTKPYEISIDVSGVTDLTIEMKGKNTNLNYYNGLYVILADAYLQR